MYRGGEVDEQAKPQPATVKVAGDIARAVYANAFNVTGGDGEISILFGLNPGRSPGQQEITIRFSDCVFLSPSTARRLVEALTRVLQEHDSRQKELQKTPDGVTTNASIRSVPVRAFSSALPENTANPPNNGAGDILSVGRAANPPTLNAAGRQADLLVKLVDGLHASYGFERSFRICPGRLQGRRFLLSVHKNALGDQAQAKLLAICRQLTMPADFQQSVGEHLAEANIIHLGFEGHGDRCVYKVYLERGVEADAGTPQLLHLAFKWDPADAARKFVTKYVWFPGLTREQISARLADIFASPTGEHRESLDIILGLLDVACRKIDASKILYLEATEDGTPRRSFDINLYRAGLQLADLYPLLARMCRRCSIPYEEFHALYEPAKARTFGHISGGIHREGEEFFSVYYGVEGRLPALPGQPAPPTPSAEST